MKGDIIKLKNKELNLLQLDKTFVCKKGFKYLFKDHLCNVLFVNKHDENGKDIVSLKLGEYLSNLLIISKESETKPAFIFKRKRFSISEVLGILNKEYNHVYEVEKLGDKANYLMCDDKNFVDSLKKFIEDRKENSNLTYVVVEEPTKEDLHWLLTFMTVAKSRNVYFVLFIDENDVLNEPELEMIENYCEIKYISKNGKVKLVKD